MPHRTYKKKLISIYARQNICQSKRMTGCQICICVLIYPSTIYIYVPEMRKMWGKVFRYRFSLANRLLKSICECVRKIANPDLILDRNECKALFVCYVLCTKKCGRTVPRTEYILQKCTLEYKVKQVIALSTNIRNI